MSDEMRVAPTMPIASTSPATVRMTPERRSVKSPSLSKIAAKTSCVASAALFFAGGRILSYAIGMSVIDRMYKKAMPIVANVPKTASSADPEKFSTKKPTAVVRHARKVASPTVRTVSINAPRRSPSSAYLSKKRVRRWIALAIPMITSSAGSTAITIFSL